MGGADESDSDVQVGSMTEGQVIAVMRLLTANWPSFPPSTDTVELWNESFRESDFEQVYQAAKTSIANDEYPPKVARIREIMREQNSYKPYGEITSGGEP